MSTDKRKRLEKQWSNLTYELANSGVKIREKFWTREALRDAAYVAVLVLASLVCVAATYALWCTAMVGAVVDLVLTYREGGLFYDSWQRPHYTPVTKVYIYNYTNVDAFLAGNDTKLRVEELGPYTYTEVIEKANVTFDQEEGTLSYSEKREYTFVPEESNGTEEDIVVVPNIPLISAMSRVRDRGFAAQLGLRSALWALNIEKGAFDVIRAREYLFGYSDRLYDVAVEALRVTGSGELPKLGILASRNGLSDNVYTIHTGALNHSLVDVVARINGKADLGAWKEPDCNRIDAPVGAIFSAEPLKTKSRLHLYHVDLCRRMDFDFQRELLVMGDIPAYRYTTPEVFFFNATDYPANACFRDDIYPNWPSGVFLNAPCFSEAPIFVSFPRFYQGDPILREVVEGMSPPEREKHQFYIDVHPDLGITLGVAIRMQANVMIRKAPMVGDYLDKFEDNAILPQLWFETVIHGYHNPTRQQLWHATYTLRWGEALLKHALPALAVVLVVLATRRARDCGAGVATPRLRVP